MSLKLPLGDTTETTTERGSLYADYANPRIVQFDDSQNNAKFRVFTYTLDKSGEVVREKEMWANTTLERFVNSAYTAYLSGHNVPGNGRYGVFHGTAPKCPECGQFMEIGSPRFHEGSGTSAIGYICAEYESSKGEHAGYMSQQECIDEGYYITVKQILKERFEDSYAC